VRIDTNLASLQALLGMSGFELQINLDVPETPDSELQLAINPVSAGGYALRVEGKLADSALELEAGSPESWSFPAHSKTRVDRLRLTPLRALLAGLDRDKVDRDLEEWLESAVPNLSLPEHEARLAIGEIRMDDEMLRDTTLNFQTGTGGYGITSLRSLGPRGILTGEASLVPRQTDWALALDATIEAREDADGIAAQYLGTDWHWQEGRAEIAGTGTTWGQLVDTLKGDLNVSGSHQANVATPVSISAQLGTQSDALVLESLDVKAGTAHLGGSLAFSGGKQRKLHLKLDGEGVDLNFLFDNPGAESLPGIPVPEYLTLVPGIEVTWEVTARDLSLPGLQLARAEISADRGVDRGRFQVRGRGDQAGALAVSLNYQPGGGGKTFVNMTVEMDKLDLEHLITGDEGLFNEKTTGNLVLNSQGESIAEVFEAMRGDADLTLTMSSKSNDPGSLQVDEELRVTGGASLVVDNERILGLKIDHLSIDSLKQDLTGEVTMAAGRSPWFTAKLSSRRFSIVRVLDWMPDSAAQADQANVLQSLRQLGDLNLSLSVGELEAPAATLGDVNLKLESGKDLFSISQLDFTFEKGRFSSSSDMVWQGDNANLNASGTMANLELDRFLSPKREHPQVPLPAPATGGNKTFEQWRPRRGENSGLGPQRSKWPGRLPQPPNTRMGSGYQGGRPITAALGNYPGRRKGSKRG
jgi:hypothetical protein